MHRFIPPIKMHPIIPMHNRYSLLISYTEKIEYIEWSVCIECVNMVEPLINDHDSSNIYTQDNFCVKDTR